jgi:RHS repeat-associated protein
VRPSHEVAVGGVLRALLAFALLCLWFVTGLTVQACSSGDGQRAPSFRDQSVEITSLPDAAEFYLADAQQSPLAVTTKTASVQSRTALHPFGQVRFQTGTQNDPWGFVGNEEDRGSGISDFHARPYRPELSVFLAVDPIALLSPEKTIGNPNRMFAYAYAGGDPITQADANGLTFGEFVHGMWDQGVENLKATASATAASVRSNVALAMSGDIEGAAANLVVGTAHGMVQTVKDVSNFGNDFAKAVYAGSDYEAGRLAVKPVMTAMNLAGTVMGARMNLEKAGASRAAALEGEAKAAGLSRQGTTVLGHYPEYKNLAENIGARRFNIPNGTWNKLTPAERWSANQKFLDRTIARGDDIQLATPLDKVKTGSYFGRELDYLRERGYSPSSDGTRMLPPTRAK